MLPGVCNFYRQFIKDYTHVAESCTQLTTTLISFTWTTKANTAFCELKRLFTTHILAHIDTKRQFILEVDAPDSGVGTVLSQKLKDDSKVLPSSLAD